MIHLNCLCFTPVLGTPAQIGNVFLSREVIEGGAALRVNWSTPSSVMPILQYKVAYRRVGNIDANPWHLAIIEGSPPAAYTCLKGLNTSRPYWVRVRAVSDDGHGPWSSLTQETTYGSELLYMSK